MLGQITPERPRTSLILMLLPVLSALIQKVLNNGADDNISLILVQGEPGKFSDRQAAA